MTAALHRVAILCCPRSAAALHFRVCDVSPAHIRHHGVVAPVLSRSALQLAGEEARAVPAYTSAADPRQDLQSRSVLTTCSHR
ncbi:hypothetical protein FKM82_028605 [Ascaphus truei]